MQEWWTYRLQDLLPYSRQTYFRMIEIYNQAVWPLQLLTLAFGIAVVLLAWRRPPRQGRVITAVLAAAWIWVAWGYHVRYYTVINWAAYGFAAAFAVEVFLLTWTGIIRNRISFEPVTSMHASAGAAIFILALAVYPFINPLLDRPWKQAEGFGTSPDPTAIATMAILLSSDRTHWGLLIIPAFWCVISAAHLWAMGAAGAWVSLLAVIVMIAFSIAKRVEQSRKQRGLSKRGLSGKHGTR